MYNFKDTIQTGTSDVALLPTEALLINNQYIENLIPGYRTLSVSGREALSPEIETFSTGIRDGSAMKHKRYPERIITVKYRLMADSPAAFRAAYTKLAYILDVEDAQLIFDDEPDKFFIGTPCAIGEVEPGRNAVVGEFEILCVDPFKYSVNEYEATLQDTEAGKAFVIDYEGTYKSFPTLTGEFYDEAEDGVNSTTLSSAGDCGFLAFFNEDGKVIQVGDAEELDGGEVPASQTLMNQLFNRSTCWGTTAKNLWSVNSAAAMPYDEAQVGTVGEVPSMPYATEGNYFMSCTNYGTSSAERYGASITRAVPADASGEVGAANFNFNFRHKHCPSDGAAGKKECGVFYALVMSGTGESRKILAGIRISKYSIGDYSGKVDFFVDGVLKESVKTPFTPKNDYFGVGGKQSSFIEKIGGTVRFDICGITRSYKIAGDFASEKAIAVTFMFARYGSAAPLAYNGVTTAKFVKTNCNTFADIPNKFSASDMVKIDCNSGEIYLNDLLRPDLGALGNDWEQFYLKPGYNMIGLTYSNWLTDAYAPTVKLRYREVFL